MAIYEHMRDLLGKPVVDWPPVSSRLPKGVVYRVALSYDQAEEGLRWTDVFADFLDRTDLDQTTGLVVGAWSFEMDTDSSHVVEALVSASDLLPNLEALFVGDIVSEECEISWIVQSDVTPLLNAYPGLTYLGVRGGNGLELSGLRHDRLTALVVESGGLGGRVVRDIVAAQLPALRHLELWLGTPDYGGTATVDDLAPLLAGDIFPALTYLGLRDSEIADQIAVAVADAPILKRIEVLDLSLGTLGDEGAAALLSSQVPARLHWLDLHHHFCSDEMVEKLLESGRVDVRDQLATEKYQGDEWRYVAVGE
jgi:hypothetical protein